MMIHMHAGLERYDGVTIELAGTRVDGASERALTALRGRSLGFVFQFFHLVPELTGFENVLLPTRVNGSRGAGARRAAELVTRLGLDDVADSLPPERSRSDPHPL